MKILEKINVGKIIFKHIETLKNYNTNKLGFDDFITFILLPLIGTGLLIYFDIGLNDRATNIIITTLSILVGLLFNVIVIIFDIIKRDSTKKIKNKLLEELLTNISYSILLSILIIVFTLLTYINNELSKTIFTGIVYFLIGNYFLTVLMVLKRMYQLFDNELKEIGKNTGANKGE
jgi:hypothetical protein